MRIRNKKSFVVVGPEGKAPKTIWSRLTHILYLLFLALLALYLIYFTFNRLTMFEVKGQVSVERVRIGALQGGRISMLSAKQGDQVRSGEEIVVLETNQQCAVKSDKAVRKLKQSIALDGQRLKSLNSRRDNTEIRKQLLIDQRRLGRVLELERRQQSGIEPLERHLDELNIEIEMLKQEIHLQEQELALLAQTNYEPDECGFERITVPVDGTVVAVNQHLHEVVNRKETILTLIPNKPDVWVEAFAKSEDHLPIIIGQRVSVRLPDKRVTEGEIVSMHASASPFPEQEYDAYIPKQSGLLIKISPINSDVAKQWGEFDRLAVTVEGKR